MLRGLLKAIKTHSSEAISLLSDCTPRPFIHLPVVVQSPNNNNKHRPEFWPKTLKKNLKASFFKPCHNCYFTITCQFVWLGFLGLFFFLYFLNCCWKLKISCWGKAVVDTMSRDQDLFPVSKRWWKLFNHQIRMCDSWHWSHARPYKSLLIAVLQWRAFRAASCKTDELKNNKLAHARTKYVWTFIIAHRLWFKSVVFMDSYFLPLYSTISEAGGSNLRLDVHCQVWFTLVVFKQPI